MKYRKSDVGQAAFKSRSPQFSARQRAAFIVFDGNKTVAEVLLATRGLGVTQDDIDHLAALDFLHAVVDDIDMTTPVPLDAIAAPFESLAERIQALDIPVDQRAQPQDLPVEQRVLEPQAVPERTPQQRYQEGKVLATQLTASLGLRGLMLNLSVESASGYQELLALFPKIQDAVGRTASRELERILKE